MNPNWLIRMAQWARNPPSPQRVKLVLAVVAICFILFGIERLVGWPDWLRVNGNIKAKY
jgi:hypothetical protein